MPFVLDRFVVAQHPAYDNVLDELRRGRKTSHWMWFVFPQLAGLGNSATSRHFEIATMEEARAYLAHPVLGPRLRECVGVVLATKDKAAEEIFGPVDAKKLQSSMTLFRRAAPDEALFATVLDRYYDGLVDSATDALLS